jgi:rhamnogalacturonan endolyase
VYVVDGPNHPIKYAPRTLVKLDGRTGRKLREVPFPGTNRAYVVVGYLDGIHPHLVMMNGYWASIEVAAIDRELNPVWSYETHSPWNHYWSAGGHAVSCVDLDGDGRDEFLMGSAALESNGKPRWSMYGEQFPRQIHRRHSDINIVGDILPDRPGLEMWVGAPVNDTMGLVDVKTGTWIWRKPAIDLQGAGFVGDIDPARPGMELYAKCFGHDDTPSQVWDAMGNDLDREQYGIPGESGSAQNWSIWWKGTAHMQVIGRDGPPVSPGRSRNMVGDVLGDWREEYCFGGDGKFHIVTADGEPERKRPSLRTDRKYYLQLIRGNRAVGYFERPLPSGPVFENDSVTSTGP